MKVNLIPHLCWLIAILLATIAFLILHVTNGAEVNSYISFASSLASLILAVVAIFYAIVSNQSFSQTAGNIQKSSERVEQSTITFKDSVVGFANELANLRLTVDKIPVSMTEMSASLSQEIDSMKSLNQESSPRPTLALATNLTEDGDYKYKISSNDLILGVSLAYYAAALSFTSSKQLSPYMINLEDEYAKGIMVGVLYNLSILPPHEIVVKSVGANFFVSSLGNFDKNDLLTCLDEVTDTHILGLKKKIDEFFKD